MLRRVRRVAGLLVLVALLGASLAAPAQAQEAEDEFDTSWFGARLGIFYRPEMNLKAEVSGTGTQPGTLFGLLGTSLDIQDDLGVTETVESEYMFQNGILEGEVFFDTRFASISLWGIAPYEYKGKAALTRAINFGGAQFSASTPVESRFRQYHVGLDIKVNIINNQYVRLSPIVAARVLGIDWEVKAQQLGLTGDTSDIDTPLTYDDAALIPYPELGLEVRAGLREWIEADLKVTGTVFTYGGLEGGTLTIDLGVTAYPIPFLGVRLGGRYMELDVKSRDDDDAKDSFDLDLEYLGATLSVIVRFG